MFSKLYQRFKHVIQYLFFSILSTVLDTFIVWISFYFFNISLTFSNTLGVVSGFFLSYFLSLKAVFNTAHSIGSFTVYLSTSIIGLIVANYLITNTYTFSSTIFPEWFAFSLSKGVSIIVPFFIMYFMRKYLYIWLNKRRKLS